jgi:hypothetical protein
VIALGFVDSWLLILTACGVLWALWGVMGITSSQLQRWLDARHRRQPATEGAGKPRKEKGSSTSP